MHQAAPDRRRSRAPSRPTPHRLSPLPSQHPIHQWRLRSNHRRSRQRCRRPLGPTLRPPPPPPNGRILQISHRHSPLPPNPNHRCRLRPRRHRRSCPRYRPRLRPHKARSRLSVRERGRSSSDDLAGLLLGSGEVQDWRIVGLARRVAERDEGEGRRGVENGDRGLDGAR